MKPLHHLHLTSSRPSQGTPPSRLSQVSAAVLLGLGLLQTAAAADVAQAVQQENTGVVSASQSSLFSGSLQTGQSVQLLQNAGTAQAQGNAAIPGGDQASLGITGESALDAVTLSLEQSNGGAFGNTVESTTVGRAVVEGGSGALSDVSASVGDNVVTSSARGNLADSSLTVETDGGLSLTGDVQLLSTQRNMNAAVSASTDAKFGVTFQGDAVAHDATVSGNQAGSLALNNDSDNRVAVTAGGGIEASQLLKLDSRQSVGVDGGLAPLSASVDVGTAGLELDGANVRLDGKTSVTNNQFDATAMRNRTDNDMKVDAGSSLTGTLLQPTFELTTVQEDLAAGSTVSATTSVGVVGLDTTARQQANAGDSFTAVVGNNQILATSGSNAARNQVGLGADHALSTVSGTLSNQQESRSRLNAEATASVGIGARALRADDNHLTVNKNEVVAQTFANQADSAVKAVTTNADALNLAVENDQTVDGSASSLVEAEVGIRTDRQLNAAQATVSANTLAARTFGNKADNAVSLQSTTLADSQLAVGSSQASGPDATFESTAYGDFGIKGGGTSVGGSAGTEATVSGNTLGASSGANTVRNTVSAAVGSTLGDSGLVLANEQSGESSVEATASGSVGISAPNSLSVDHLTVSKNSIQASAYANQAQNAVKAEAVSADNAVLALLNEQSAAGVVSSTAEGEFIIQGQVEAGIDATVTGNTLSAMARANVADNQLALTGTNVQNGTSGIGSIQNNTAAVSARVGTFAGVGVSGNFAQMPKVTVSDNALNATALGNVATNALSAGSTVAPSGTYGVLNAQTNSGNIAAQISGDPVVPVRASAGQDAAVLGNVLNATAYANYADNRVTMSALPSQASSQVALASSQINSGNVSAQVNNAYVSGSVAAANGSVAVARNQASANAVGNMSVSSISIGTH